MAPADFIIKVLLWLSADELVHLAYRGILTREADSVGLAAYSKTLKRSTDLSHILKELSSSDEFWDKIFATHAPAMVRALYQGLLGRDPEAEAEKAYAEKLASNNDLIPLLEEISRSDEHWNKSFATRAPAMVRALYQGLLGRDPEAEAEQAYAEKLASNNDLIPLLEEISLSDEHWNKFVATRAPAMVRMLYQGLLGRDPEADAEQAYAEKLASNNDLIPLLEEISRSDEHWNKSFAARAPAMVRALYQGLLGRNPEADAEQAYAEKLASNNDLIPLLEEISRSDEHWNKSFAARAPAMVRALYQGLLGRDPEAEAEQAYAERLMSNNDLIPLLEEISRSDEHWEKTFATRAPAMVRVLYQGLLGRDPEAEAEQAYTERLMSNNDLIPLLEEISRSDEHWEKNFATRAPALVRMLYQGLLGRDPEAEAEQAYAERLASSNDLIPLFEEISGSDEQWARIIVARAPALVNTLYQGLLGREADKEALDGYTKFLAKTRDLTKLLNNIINSVEFEKARQLSKKWPNPIHTYEKPTLVFIHIQKTAGTSLQNMLFESYGHKSVYREHFDSLYRYSPSELSRYSAFLGHFDFDSLAFIPRKKLSIFTFVRKPKERLYALYHFWRAHEPSYEFFGEDMKLANELPITSFFEDERIRVAPLLWNHITWAIIGQRQWIEWRALLFAENNENEINKLIVTSIRPKIRSRLEEFIFVGLKEQFDISVKLLFEILQRPQPEKIRVDHTLEQLAKNSPNYFKKEMEKQPMTSILDSILDRFVQLDNIVYEEAEKLFFEQLNKYRL